MNSKMCINKLEDWTVSRTYIFFAIIEEFRNYANQMPATALTRELNHATISRDFKLKDDSYNAV